MPNRLDSIAAVRKDLEQKRDSWAAIATNLRIEARLLTAERNGRAQVYDLVVEALSNMLDELAEEGEADV